MKLEDFKKKILIVDDEPQIVQLLAKRLRANGYETYAAQDSIQCIIAAKEVRPDLILLDIKMPLGGGIKAFENLKLSTYTSDIPIIFITAYPSSSIKKQVMKLGADGFFAKPFDAQELFGKIKELIEK